MLLETSASLLVLLVVTSASLLEARSYVGGWTPMDQDTKDIGLQRSLDLLTSRI